MKSKILAFFSQEIWAIGSIKSEFVLQRNLEVNISLTFTTVMDDQIWHSYFGIRSCEKSKYSKNQEKIRSKI